MSFKNLNSRQALQVLELVKQRESIVTKISQIEKQLENLPEEPKPNTVVVKKARKKGARKPGGLKEKIMAALKEAGPKGIHAKDLAKTLGVKPLNISVWFYTTGKSITKKVAPNTFALKA